MPRVSILRPGIEAADPSVGRSGKRGPVKVSGLPCLKIQTWGTQLHGPDLGDPPPTEMTREFENLQRQENEDPWIKKLLGAK